MHCRYTDIGRDGWTDGQIHIHLDDVGTIVIFFVDCCLAYCIKIKNPSNGGRHGTSFSHGKVVSFECNVGYKLVGDRALRCINGRWNSTVPVCNGENKL